MKTDKPLLPQSYTSADLDKMEKTWDKSSFAMALDARVRGIEKAQKATFVELGLICLRVERLELWRNMGGRFHSFGSWISDATLAARATAYAALGEVKKALADGLSIDAANEMPRCNLKTINRLSTKLKSDPVILNAAKTMPERDFKRKLEKEHPDQHIEDDSPMRFKPTKSQRKTIDAAIDAVEIIYEESMSREECLEIIAIDWLNSNQKKLEKAMAVGA